MVAQLSRQRVSATKQQFKNMYNNISIGVVFLEWFVPQLRKKNNNGKIQFLA